MREIMIDIETLDKEPTAAILSIGAVAFTREAGVLYPMTGTADHLHVNISQNDRESRGLTVSQSTVEWWSRQSDEAKRPWKTRGRSP